MKKSIFILLLSFSLLSCKKDEDKTPLKSDKYLITTAESETLLKQISRAYNVEKFKSENILNYNLKLELGDVVLYDDAIRYKVKTNELAYRSLDSIIAIDDNTPKNTLENTLLLFNEIYALPFSISANKIEVLTTNDSILSFSYKSEFTSTAYKIHTHPLTKIFQTVELNSELENLVNQQFDIQFDRYITVNRIPISMKWKLFSDKKIIGEVSVGRIRYE